VSVGEISSELLHRYNVPGPRYTSYPTAPVWTEELGPEDFRKALAKGAAGSHPAPLSLYLHLPYCESLCHFCACTVVITGSNHSVEARYLAALEREAEAVAAAAGDRPVVQLHWGGGTPTYFSPERLEHLGRHLRARFRVDPAAEIGVEIDPRVTTRAHLEVLASLGVNRLSFGVQDFEPAVQEAIHRIQPFEQTRDLMAAARDLGFPSVNIDLIYGLPHQTPASFDRTIDAILDLAPDRLAVYSYANVPWMKKHQRLLEPHLPSEGEKFEIFRTALSRFLAAGFEYIGMDHFARPEDELARARRDRTLHRNFQGYTTKAGTDLLGMGMSAISSVGDAYFQNRREHPAYLAAVEATGGATFRGLRLSDEDLLRRRVIQALLCHGVVVKAEIEREFSIDFDAHFADALARLKPCAEDGLVALSPEAVTATALGRVFLRNLAMPFDAHLASEAARPVFSRTL
jgi:oxygen-independent coproporphyrinogen-3 oxidase